MSAFNIKYKEMKIDYRFDFYQQSNDCFSVKPEFDNCTELSIDFNINQFDIKAGGISLNEVKDLKNSKTGNIECYYYPGFNLSILAVRDPLRKTMGLFLPSLVIGLYLIYSMELKSFE